MDSMLSYITRYSPPVILFIFCVLTGGYFIKYGLERTLEVEFKKRDKQLEFAIQRQSNFQEKVLWQKYTVLTEQNKILHKLRSDINGYLQGNQEEKSFMQNGHMFELTDLYETLNSNRFLIGDEMYEHMRKHAGLLIKFSRVPSSKDKQYKELIKGFLNTDDQYNLRMRSMFNITDQPESMTVLYPSD